MSFVLKAFSLQNLRTLQDGFFALMVLGVSVTFMLFLLGSTSILTSLSMIGVLLCLSLVGSILRFFSMTRTDTAMGSRQDDFDKTLLILGSRVGDHDLTLLKMAGQIEQVEQDVHSLKKSYEGTVRSQNLMLQTMKNRIVQMMQTIGSLRVPSSVGQEKTYQKPAQKEKQKSFFPPSSTQSNDTGVHQTDFSKDDDVYVSPALLREAVDAAITQKRIDVYMQPIVTLPTRHVAAYELYGRVRLSPGVYIPATQYRGIAIHGKKQADLDHLALQEISRLFPTMGDALVFVNVCADILTHGGALATLTRLLREQPRLRSRLVLSLPQREGTRLGAAHMRVMRELQKIGVAFGINDVQGMDLDLDLLADLNIRFLKLPYDRFITTTHSDQGAAILHRFMTRLRTRGIQFIAGHVETPDQIRAMLDYPIMYAQGHLFGRPDRPLAYQLKAKQKVA